MNDQRRAAFDAANSTVSMSSAVDSLLYISPSPPKPPVAPSGSLIKRYRGSRKAKLGQTTTTKPRQSSRYKVLKSCVGQCLSRRLFLNLMQGNQEQGDRIMTASRCIIVCSGFPAVIKEEQSFHSRVRSQKRQPTTAISPWPRALLLYYTSFPSRGIWKFWRKGCCFVLGRLLVSKPLFLF